jgi:DNA-binding response OmpR family regulator/cell division FtsZ-interacting protein ZapD
MGISNTSSVSRTILVVDDDSSAVSLYSNRLEQAGFNTTSATGTGEAFKALPNLTADLIIVDLMLPKLRGLELLQAIRANDRHRNTPILVLSNAYLPDLSQRAIRAGGNRTLPRSECTVAQLLSATRSLLGVEGESTEPAATDELKQVLIEAGRAEVTSLRQQCQAYSGLADSNQAEECLHGLYRSVRSLCSRAGLAGCGNIAQLSGATEAMLFDQLFRSKKPMPPSSIRTLFQAVDCLERLFANRDMGPAALASTGSVLLVDDNSICNMANEVALQRANYEAASATDAGSAMTLINEYTFDLVLLDIELPGKDGIELCKEIRTVPHHQHTPVIFVTRHSDYDSRMKSLQSGGDDLISKPIAPLELVVKSTVLLLSTSKPPIPDVPPRFRKRLTTAAAAAQTDNASSTGTKDQNSASNADSPRPADSSKKLSALQLAVRENLKHLRESLVEETRRLQAVEEQVAESAQRRAKLEAAIEENQRCQAQFDRLVEELQRETLDGGPGEDGERSNLEGRRRALIEVSCFVNDKLVELKRALTEETHHREALEHQMAENGQRRGEFEAALEEVQRIQQVFTREVEHANNSGQLAALESSLSVSQQAWTAVQEDLEKARRELEALQNRPDVDQEELAKRTNELEARTRELQAAGAQAEAEVRRIKEELTAEIERREALKQEAAEHNRYRDEIEAALAGNEQTERALQREIEASERAKLRGELEAQLAESKQARSMLQQELDEARKQLRAREEHDPESEVSLLESRTQQLESARADVERQVKQRSPQKNSAGNQPSGKPARSASAEVNSRPNWASYARNWSRRAVNSRLKKRTSAPSRPRSGHESLNCRPPGRMWSSEFNNYQPRSPRRPGVAKAPSNRQAKLGYAAANWKASWINCGGN